MPKSISEVIKLESFVSGYAQTHTQRAYRLTWTTKVAANNTG